MFSLIYSSSVFSNLQDFSVVKNARENVRSTFLLFLAISLEDISRVAADDAT